MRMLLTSAGLADGAIAAAFTGLVGRPLAETDVAVVLTASLVTAGDKRFVLEGLNDFDRRGVRTIDILDLASGRAVVEDRLRGADVIYVEGGDYRHLTQVIAHHDLAGLLLELVESKVYVGASAGSMIFGQHLDERGAALFGEEQDGTPSPFGLFGWHLKSHWHAPYAPERDDAWADRVAAVADFPVYLIDDSTALRVRGTLADPVVDVISTGDWRLVGPPLAGSDRSAEKSRTDSRRPVSD